MPKNIKNCKESLKKATKKKGERRRISVRKTNSGNQITKSKQLLKSIKNNESTLRSVARKPVPKVCSNTTLMPSLADLEKMFENSGDETDANETTSSSGNFGNRNEQIPNTEIIEIIDGTLSSPVINYSSLPENQRFSPLPSTSRDRNTFLENDKRLKNSTTSFDKSSEESQSDVEIIDEVCEIIVINDEPETVSSGVLRVPHNTVTHNPGSPIVIDDHAPEPRVNLYDCRAYSSTDNLEMIDIDNILARNKAILQKQWNKKPLNAITKVEPSTVINSNASDSDLSLVENENLITNNNTPDLPNLTSIANDTSQAVQRRKNNCLKTRTCKCSKCQVSRYPLARYIIRRLAERSRDVEETRLVYQYLFEESVEENSTKSKGLGTGSCPICMDRFSGQEIVATYCGHIFCKKCIDTALRASGRKCPTCRKPFKGPKSYHQLFL